MKPNTKFELTVADLELIESALHHQLATAYKLLGKLHNQKVWYRPKKKIYVGG